MVVLDVQVMDHGRLIRVDDGPPARITPAPAAGGRDNGNHRCADPDSDPHSNSLQACSHPIRSWLTSEQRSR
jgi:hypothetical protein